MRYSAPFGTPDPPLGTYPRYINGNPVTGTEGSIPPNTSIDEDQIEIVTVIANTQALVGDPTLVPSHDDLSQLWRALQALFAQKYITTPITKTVHGTGADFPNLIEALKWVAQYIITPTGSVTFIVAQGQWVYTQSIELSHPDSQRITIQGHAPNGQPTVGGMSVTGPMVSGDMNAQLAYLRLSLYTTELNFTGGVTGFKSLRAGTTIKQLLITGDGATSGSTLDDGNGVNVFANLYVHWCSIHGFGRSGYFIQNASLICTTSTNLSVSGCRFTGVLMYHGSVICYGAGAGQYFITTSNAVAWTLYGSYALVGLCDVRGCDASSMGFLGACNVEEGSQFIVSPGSKFGSETGSAPLNKGSGVYVAGSSTFQGEQCTYGLNSAWGLYMDGGKAWVESSNIPNLNGAGAIACLYGANCDALHVPNLNALPVTPPLNTVGNSNSYITWAA